MAIKEVGRISHPAPYHIAFSSHPDPPSARGTKYKEPPAALKGIRDIAL